MNLNLTHIFDSVFSLKEIFCYSMSDKEILEKNFKVSNFYLSLSDMANLAGREEICQQKAGADFDPLLKRACDNRLAT